MTPEQLRANVSAYIAGLSMGGDNETVTNAIMNDVAALTAALSDQVVVPKDEDAHAWHMKPTTIPDEMFKRPMFVADALRKMVANCVSLHPAGSSLYTDGERKAMLAAAEHIETFVSVAPPPSSTAGEGK